MDFTAGVVHSSTAGSFSLLVMVMITTQLVMKVFSFLPTIVATNYKLVFDGGGEELFPNTA